MLDLAPIRLQGGHFALPLDALAPLGLDSTRRRFLSPGDALAWFLAAPWGQPSRGPSPAPEDIDAALAALDAV